MSGAVAQSKAPPPGIRTVAGSILRSSDIHSWRLVIVEFGHEIISAAILTLLLIQVRQLSVTGERM